MVLLHIVENTSVVYPKKYKRREKKYRLVTK